MISTKAEAGEMVKINITNEVVVLEKFLDHWRMTVSQLPSKPPGVFEFRTEGDPIVCKRIDSQPDEAA